MLTPYGQSFVNSVSSLRPGTAAGEDSSRNVPWLALWHGLQGENWQRNYHARPGAVRLGWTGRAGERRVVGHSGTRRVGDRHRGPPAQGLLSSNYRT